MPPLPTSTKDNYSTVEGVNVAETSFNPEQSTANVPHPAVEEGATLIHYLKSIVFMPRSLRMVCLTNLFCWMAHVCYSLYFTDFVGEAVFLGDPRVRVFKDPFKANLKNKIHFRHLKVKSTIYMSREYVLDAGEWQCIHFPVPVTHQL